MKEDIVTCCNLLYPYMHIVLVIELDLLPLSSMTIRLTTVTSTKLLSYHLPSYSTALPLRRAQDVGRVLFRQAV
jgi:hypothetical protein